MNGCLYLSKTKFCSGLDVSLFTSVMTSTDNPKYARPSPLQRQLKNLTCLEATRFPVIAARHAADIAPRRPE